MPLTLERIIDPLDEPVTLSDMKDHMRVDITDDDDLIGAYIEAARDDLEESLHRALMTSTWRLYLDDWPDTIGRHFGVHTHHSARRTIDFRNVIRIPMPPVQEVSMIQYFDTDDVLQTLATTVYQVDKVSQPARVTLKTGQTWPSLRANKLNAVIIQYVAGYVTSAQIPALIRHVLKLIVGDLYEHRETQLDLSNIGIIRIQDNPTYQRMLWKHRVLEMR